MGVRRAIGSLDGRCFDVAVIGAGVNEAGAAQHLAAAGYDVLLVDKGEFASGSSSRSSRSLHCGLRYPAPGASMWEFARHPGRLMTALRMARQAMACRRQFVENAPERAAPLTFYFPFYDDSLRLLNHEPEVRLGDIRRAVREEHAGTLIDVMFRRTAAGWSETMGREEAYGAARVLGEELGWSPERIAREAEDFLRFVERQFCLAPIG